MKGRKAKRRGEGPAAAAPRAGRVDPDRSGFATVEEAVRDIADGRMVIVVDDEERENEGDLTIAADNARFGQTGPRVGSFDAGLGAGLMARTIGLKRAKEIWLLCRQYDAATALDWGLVNAVVPVAELEDTVREWLLLRQEQHENSSGEVNHPVGVGDLPDLRLPLVPLDDADDVLVERLSLQPAAVQEASPGAFRVTRCLLIPSPVYDGAQMGYPVLSVQEQVGRQGAYEVHGARLLGLARKDEVLGRLPTDWGWWEFGRGLADRLVAEPNGYHPRLLKE